MIKDIKSEPKDVQDVYYSITEYLDAVIENIIQDKKSVIWYRDVLMPVSSDLGVDYEKLRSFLKTFSGDKYLYAYGYVCGQRYTKQWYGQKKNQILKKLKRNKRLKNFYQSMSDDTGYDVQYTIKDLL
jgi:hypothetical protein